MKTKMVRRPERREDDSVLRSLEPKGFLLPAMNAWKLRALHDGLTRCDSNPGAAFSLGETFLLTWDDLEAISGIIEEPRRTPRPRCGVGASLLDFVESFDKQPSGASELQRYDRELIDLREKLAALRLDGEVHSGVLDKVGSMLDWMAANRPEVAPGGALTDEEVVTARNAAAGACNETDALVRIIERLSGQEISEGDEP